MKNENSSSFLEVHPQAGYKPLSNPMQRRLFCIQGLFLWVTFPHKTSGNSLHLINQNAQYGSQETAGMLFFKQEHIQKGQRLDTTVYCCWTCLEKSEERKIKTDRKRDREKKWDRNRWSVIAYVCGVKTKEAEAAKHVFKLVYVKNKTAQREKKLKRDQRLRTHAERGATCRSIVVNLWV